MDIKVSVTTIIDRAKKLDCHKPRRKRKIHDREVVTASIGALIQHDASTHLWCPQAQEKWTLITSIDDYSRKLLFANFFRSETTWCPGRIFSSAAIRARQDVEWLRMGQARDRESARASCRVSHH